MPPAAPPQTDEQIWAADWDDPALAGEVATTAEPAGWLEPLDWVEPLGWVEPLCCVVVGALVLWAVFG